MSDERLPIVRIINSWKAQCGETYVGSGGTPYIRIPTDRMLESLKILAKTFFDAGYTYDEIDSVYVAVKIADITFVEEKIVKMTTSAIKRAKVGLTLDWQLVLAQFSGIQLSELDENEKVVVTAKSEPNKKAVLPKKADFDWEKVEIIPKNTVKMDNSDTPDRIIDYEFLKELGIDESFFRYQGEKDE
jgi:hypothetical protein